MSDSIERASAAFINSNTIQLVTFQCGDLLVGLDLSDVQEINRQSNFAEVPEASRQIRGVINLRGEVITMVDLRVVLCQTEGASGERTHNVFVRHDGEVIGLVTDGVADIVAISPSNIDAPPTYVKSVDNSFFRGVHTTPENELVVILDLTQVMSQVSGDTSVCTS